MNIFYLDTNPALCAEYHCDKHVVKMIIEYAQMLSTAHRVIDGEEVKVKLIELDERSGKLRLSRKVLLEKPDDYVERPPREKREGDSRGRDNRSGGRDNNRGRDNRGGGRDNRGGDNRGRDNRGGGDRRDTRNDDRKPKPSTDDVR